MVTFDEVQNRGSIQECLRRTVLGWGLLQERVSCASVKTWDQRSSQMRLNTPEALPRKAALREGTRVHWPTNRANWWPGLKRSPASKDKVRSSVRRQLTSTSGFCASACARITAHYPNNWVRSSLKFRWYPRKGIWVAIACISS